MKPKSIFEPVRKETNTKDTPSFLRSRHNFSGKDTYVNKSISIPKIEKSMLATNRDKKLVFLEQQEIEKLKKEEKMRLKELREEEKKKKEKRKRSNSQSDSGSTKRKRRRKRKNKNNNENPENNEKDNENDNDKNNETDYYETDAYETDAYETDYYETDKEPTTPKSNKSAPSSPEVIVLDSFSDEDFPANEITSSPVSVINSPGTPLMPISLSPTDINRTSSSPTLPFISNDTLRRNSNTSIIESIPKVPDYLKNVNVNLIESSLVSLSPLNSNKYLFENKSDIEKIFDNNWFINETNKLSKKYFDTELLDNENEMDTQNDDDTFNNSNNIYLRIYNFNKKSKVEQEKNPLKFKYNYFPSKDELYPNSINKFIRLTKEERRLRNKYINIE